MKRIGTWLSPRWGKVLAFETVYGDAKGPLAVILESDGEPLATLSVNMYKPACSQDSCDLPARCFYVKTWSENTEVSREALVSGLFRPRDDLPAARSGFIEAPVWEILS